jgi:hypothetical protein
MIVAQRVLIELLDLLVDRASSQSLRLRVLGLG